MANVVSKPNVTNVLKAQKGRDKSTGRLNRKVDLYTKAEVVGDSGVPSNVYKKILRVRGEIINFKNPNEGFGLIDEQSRVDVTISVHKSKLLEQAEAVRMEGKNYDIVGSSEDLAFGARRYTILHLTEQTGLNLPID